MWLLNLFKSRTLHQPVEYTDDEASRKASQLVDLFCTELERAGDVTKPSSSTTRQITDVNSASSSTTVSK